MLSINSIARVIVTASRSASTPSAFDTGLLLVRRENEIRAAEASSPP